MWRFAVEGGWCSVLDMEYVRVTSEPAGPYHRHGDVQGSQANCSLLSFLLHLARRAGKYENRKRRILIPELNKRSLPGLWLLSWSVLLRLAGAALMKKKTVKVRSCSFCILCLVLNYRQFE
jgi:hypothetical protein